MTEIVIAGALRTAIGKFGGAILDGMGVALAIER
jgi:acetyl-CoA acetyltransferase